MLFTGIDGGLYSICSGL